MLSATSCSILVGSLNFLDVDEKLLVGHLLNLSFQLFDLSAALTDYNAGLCSVDDNLNAVRCSLDLDLGNACAV